MCNIIALQKWWHISKRKEMGHFVLSQLNCTYGYLQTRKDAHRKWTTLLKGFFKWSIFSFVCIPSSHKSYLCLWFNKKHLQMVSIPPRSYHHHHCEVVVLLSFFLHPASQPQLLFYLFVEHLAWSQTSHKWTVQQLCWMSGLHGLLLLCLLYFQNVFCVFFQR